MGTNPTCSEIGDDNGRKIDIQDVPNSTYNTGDFDGSNSVTVSNSGLDNGQYLFDWTSTFGVDTVIVKQSDDAHNVYEYGSPDFGDTGLGPHPGQNQGGISHVDFCYDDPPTTGQLTIVKISDPRDGTDFSFNFSNPTQTDIPFTLDDASPDDNDGKSETKVFSDLPPGLYKVTETVTSGRTLDSVVCVPSDHTSGITNGADVNLVAGDDITCTFTNTKDPTTAKLTIVKVSDPSDGTDFSFNLSNLTQTDIPFVLDDDNGGDGGTFSFSITNQTTGDISNATFDIIAFEDSDNPACVTKDVPVGDAFLVSETGTPGSWSDSTDYPKSQEGAGPVNANSTSETGITGPAKVAFYNENIPPEDQRGGRPRPSSNTPTAAPTGPSPSITASSPAERASSPRP